MSHTLGPWIVEGSGSAVTTDNGLFFIANCGYFDSRKENEGNALLIAAAPEMLSLLEDCQEYLCELGGPAVELLERVDSIINKARGAG